MFHREVAAYKTREAQQHQQQQIRREEQSFLSTTKPNPSATSSVSSADAHFGKAFKQEPLAVSSKYVNKPFAPVYHGTKRTANGLIKAIGGPSQEAFQDYSPPTSTNDVRIIVAGENAASSIDTSKENHNVIIINEDDFGSDLDWDGDDEIEVAPLSKGTVSYPKLPSINENKDNNNSGIADRELHSRNADPLTTKTTQSKQQVPSLASPTKAHVPPTKSSLSYPSLAKHHVHTQAAIAEKSFDSNAANGTPVSSNNITIPWSSSPADHLNPPPPPKRRTLPWLEQPPLEDEKKDKVPVVSMLDMMKTPRPLKQQKTHKAPSEDSPTSNYPWNTTASALKQQQKEHKKATKKAALAEVEDQPREKMDLFPSQLGTKTNAIKRISLSKEQRHVMDLVVEKGQSIFFTGSAGTGKSVLLREIISVLRKKHIKETDRVAITASTGLAACNLGGVTLHSFAGIGLGKEEVPELVKKIKRNQKAKHRWMRTKILIVDEISMVDGDLFDKLENIARVIRSNGRPFGGIQLVITGDFFQLPPVPDHGSGRVAKFSFDAKTWSSAIEHTIGLHHVFRQKDPAFANMLNEMREGRISQQSINAFRSLSRDLQFDDMMSATELFPTRAEVDNSNNVKMRQLAGGTQIFEARDGGVIEDPVARGKLLQNCMAPSVLELKKGSQVMLIKNMDESLVNGSLGKVIGFMNDDLFNSYDTERDDFLAAQASEDVQSLTPAQMKLRFKMEAAKLNSSQNWPMVRFSLADGTTRDLLCHRETWKIELPNGEVQASRAQVPLILAWALSIHKAQGQTLDRVKVDLGKVFEKGQAYVALSRATSMAGLQVLNFDPKKVVAHDRVRTFYAGLSRLENASTSEV